MGELTITINQRDYHIACDDGDEPRLSALGTELDRRVGEVVASVGQVGHARLLVISSLVMSDELAEARAEIARLESRVAELEQGAAAPDGGADGAAAAPSADAETAAALESAAERIDAIAAKLQAS